MIQLPVYVNVREKKFIGMCVYPLYISHCTGATLPEVYKSLEREKERRREEEREGEEDRREKTLRRDGAILETGKCVKVWQNEIIYYR